MLWSLKPSTPCDAIIQYQHSTVSLYYFKSCAFFCCNYILLFPPELSLCYKMKKNCTAIIHDVITTELTQRGMFGALVDMEAGCWWVSQQLVVGSDDFEGSCVQLHFVSIKVGELWTSGRQITSPLKISLTLYLLTVEIYLILIPM